MIFYYEIYINFFCKFIIMFLLLVFCKGIICNINVYEESCKKCL